MDTGTSVNRNQNQDKIDARIQQTLSAFSRLSPFSAGYPVNQNFDYTSLYPLLAYAANNVGDPFGG